jgi:hypothetical protein
MFYDEFTVFLAANLDSKLCIVCGDFNKSTTLPLKMLNFNDIVNFPTRMDVQLDNVFVSDINLYRCKRHAPISTSDHCVIRILPKIYGKVNSKNFTGSQYSVYRKRDTCQKNIQNLKDMVMLTDFSIFQEESIDRYTEVFTDYLKFCYDVCCPTSIYFVSPLKLSTPHLKFLRRKKEKFYKLRQYQTVKYYSKLISHEIEDLNRTFIGNIFTSNNASDLWSGIKRLTGQSRAKIEGDVDIDELNKSFIHEPCSVQENYSIRGNNPIQFTPLSIEIVYKTLIGLRSNSSQGADGLPPLLIKECAPFVAPTITEILNKSFSEGKLPSAWKTVRITPIPKKTTASSVSNFRPIASSSVLLKVAEKMVLSNISPQLASSTDPMQFAYKKNRSTLDAVATLFHTISSSIDAGAKFFQCAFLDFSSAFNTICRRKVLEILNDIGAPSWCLEWLCDYFTNRLQYVTINKNKSLLSLNCHGVLQGAVLSPFLFNLYTDVMRAPQISIFIKYADDFALGNSHRSSTDTEHLQSVLTTVMHWSTDNDLFLNFGKCNVCVFSANRKLIQSSEQVILGDNALEQIQNVKYLGVYFCSNLTWSTHIDVLYKKCLKLSFYVRRLRGAGLPHHVLLKFVNLCIIPVILYASPIIFPGLLVKDFVILKRALKLVSRSSCIPYVDLCKTVINQHFSACRKFCDRILDDANHPLHQALNSTRSNRNTRRAFVHMFARTASYTRSCLPYLSRFLTNEDSEIEKLTSSLLV